MKRKTFSILFALVLVLSFSLIPAAPVAAAANIYVDPTGSDTTGDGSAAFPYQTIGKAVLVSSAGDTIGVAPGTYTEGQINIIHNLTIVGDASNKPVINPSGDLTGDNAAGAWFLVDELVAFSIRDVVIDGGSRLIHQAIRSHGNTTIENVDFTTIWGATNGSNYRGVAVENFGGTIPGGAGSDTHSGGLSAATLAVTGCTFTDIGRIGILVKGTGSSATIYGITYTGKGPIDCLDYAVEAGAGGHIDVQDSLITNCTGVASVDGSTSAGILVTDYYGTGTSAIIYGNTITGNTDGIAVGYDGADASVVDANGGNNIYGNEYGISSSGTSTSIDANNNWWGSSDGPAPVGSGDEVINVTVALWASSKFADSSTALTAVIPSIIAITVTPTSINYGTIYAGFPSDVKVITVMNIGTAIAEVGASLTYNTGAFQYLKLDGTFIGTPWAGISTLLVGTSQGVNTMLDVPASYTAKGAEYGTILFVASTPPQTFSHAVLTYRVNGMWGVVRSPPAYPV